jgi:hypothetical protein
MSEKDIHEAIKKIILEDAAKMPPLRLVGAAGAWCVLVFLASFAIWGACTFSQHYGGYDESCRVFLADLLQVRGFKPFGQLSGFLSYLIEFSAVAVMMALLNYVLIAKSTNGLSFGRGFISLLLVALSLASLAVYVSTVMSRIGVLP